VSVRLEELVGAIHDSPVQCVLYLTGGGSRALSYLLCEPGASRTVLEAVVPYSQESLAELLGRGPEQAVSTEVAEELAHRAFERAYDLSRAAPAIVGLSCTAGLATDRPRRGEHQCFVGACGYETGQIRLLGLTKAARTRAEEEEVAARLILNALAEACSVGARLDLGLLPGEQVRDVTLDA
jgi:nicotinamide mononucleotide (NMN) deamidase PncC